MKKIGIVLLLPLLHQSGQAQTMQADNPGSKYNEYIAAKESKLEQDIQLTESNVTSYIGGKHYDSGVWPVQTAQSNFAAANHFKIQ